MFFALACCAALAVPAHGQSTIFSSSAAPATVDSKDGKAIEVGVKFKADSNGTITGLRFYKASTNTGVHVAHLWDASGNLLGSATFSSETGSGWQQVNFATPIAVTANTVYVGSYFAPVGHYSQNTNAFQTAGVDNPPLHALADGVSGHDGVYIYSSQGGFPTNSVSATNYWVDVVFTPPSSSAAIGFAQMSSATPQSPTATVNVTYPGAQTAGNMNVVVVGWNDTTATVQSVKDSAGNTYSLAIGPTSTTGMSQSIYYAPKIAGGSNTVTVTFSQAAAYPDVRILEYSGVNALDVTAGASGNSATASSGAATTKSANELIFGADMVQTSTGAAGSGFTSRIITSPDGDIAEDKIVSAAGSNSATATLSSSGPWVMQMATFAAVGAPTVASVSPNSGSTSGGTAVTITGTNFASGATVTFGSTAATNVAVVNNTTITATTPAGSAGAAAVKVINPGGQSASLNGAFTYTTTTSPPSSSGPSFAQMASATPQNATATVNVTYPKAQTAGNMNIVVVGWNDTTATVQSVKDSAGNTYSLAIGPTSGTGLQQSIYYAPNIAGGNNSVTVTFNQAAGYPDVRVLEYSGVNALDVTAGASGNSATASSGAATTKNANELIFGANMVQTSTGAAGSGFTSRIITSPDGDIAEDKIASAAGSNSATASLGSAGAWVMQMAAFATVSGQPAPTAPTVASVSPNSGSTSGGTAVTITGTNFASGATVTFGGTAATNVAVVNNTTITATTPAGSAGAATVTVTNSGGQSGSLSSAFTYATSTTTSPQLSLSGTSLSFGSVAVGSSAMQSLTLTSSGSAPVTVTSITLSGAAFSDVPGTLPVTLNPNQSLTVSVTFTPTAAGSASGQITVTSNSSSGSTATVSLSGTGTVANPQLSLSATSLSFGSVAVNSSSKQSLTLTSSGSSAVTISSASVTGSGFSLVGGSFPLTLNPNQTATLQVQFAPTASGSATGSLAINSNSSSGSTASVALSGTGTGTPTSHQVSLSWSAPSSSPDPVAGYNIYRSVGGGTAQLVNSAVSTGTSFVDTSVTSGATYAYYVTSVDKSGVQSSPSNQISASVP